LINAPVEIQVKLDKFKPRPYQLAICDAFENKGFKKLIVVLPRRAGKDIVAFNLLLRAALKRVGAYLYLLPTAVQARRVLFEGMTNEGQRIIDFIPKELIKNINIQQMKVTLVNGSQIIFTGSNNFDNLRGYNAVGVVISEAAYSHPRCYPTLRPMLTGNDGFVMMVSTPFADNHFYTLFEVAKNFPKEWYSLFLTVDETKHITREQIQFEIDSGELSPDMAEQEYFCSFSIGAIGAYYAKYLNRMELNDQIGHVDWEPNYPVSTAWDIGVNDQTVILFLQQIGRQINIIDMYINSDVGMEHYINVVQSKDYVYAKHIGPHDLEVRDWTAGGMTRREKAAQLDFNFEVAPKLSLIDGIESVRTTLPRIYIDDRKCKQLISALRNYRKEYNQETKTYANKPLHDYNSHIADALRYLCVGLPLVKADTTPEELEQRYQRAMYGDRANMPGIFRDDLSNY
jgi:phage terminase large subunit